jgi:hypothetical protein
MSGKQLGRAVTAEAVQLHRPRLLLTERARQRYEGSAQRFAHSHG